jgi:RimJ/RimL family protein N-acetyltransferase
VFISGKTINLRVITEACVPDSVAWFNDQRVTDNLVMYLPMTEKREKEWIDSLYGKDATDIHFAIVTKDGRHIGNIGIHGINWRDRTGATGTVIGEKEFRGKGIGTEAKMLILNYAFNSIGLRKICSRAFSFNLASQRFNEKCGYQREGLLRQHSFKNGEYVDQVVLAVFCEDWLPLWEKFKQE